jgi:hypothetical protein
MKTLAIHTNEMTLQPFFGRFANQTTHNLTGAVSASTVATTHDQKEVTMKTQISKQHATTLGVQRPTILNPKINSGLLWQAFVMLLLIAAIVVPGAAQGIYVSNNKAQAVVSSAYFGEYKLDGTPVNIDLGGKGHSVVQGITVFGSSLIVPFYDFYLSYGANGSVWEFNAETGQLFSYGVFPILNSPRAAVVSGGYLFVLYNYGNVGEYDPKSGATINPTLVNDFGNGEYIAASPGPGGTVNLFMSTTNSIEKITVSGNTATPPTTLVSGLNYPAGIAVSEDGNYVYVVIPQSPGHHNVGEIDEYDATTGSPVQVPLVSNISGGPWDIAVSGSNLLVTLKDGNAVGEYDASTGATVNASLITGLDNPLGIAVTPGDGSRFCTPPPSKMVAWYSFDQNLPGGVQYDLAKGNDATTHWTQSVVPGEVSNAVYFDGTSYADAPDKSWLNMGTGNLSIDAWVKIASPADYTGSHILVDKRQSSPLQGYSFLLYNGRLTLQLAHNGSYYNYLTHDPIPADNQWHFIAVTVIRGAYGGGAFYLDGDLVGFFDTIDSIGSLDSSAPLEIGVAESSLGGGGYFKGALDELEIFNRFLDSSEVESLYQAGSAGKCK